MCPMNTFLTSSSLNLAQVKEIAGAALLNDEHVEMGGGGFDLEEYCSQKLFLNKYALSIKVVFNPKIFRITPFRDRKIYYVCQLNRLSPSVVFVIVIITGIT